MSNAITTKPQTQIGALEALLIQGDLSHLSPQQRVTYYFRVCETLDLNPYTQPFEYIVFQGKLTLYAKRNCSDQLRQKRGISVRITSRERVGDLLVVTAQASTPDGRVDESIGAISLGKLQGDALANAMMKAETKAKRRVTLSICGLSFSDESEVEGIPGKKETVPMQLPPKDEHPNFDPAAKALKPAQEKKAEAKAIEAEVVSSAPPLEAAAYVVTFGKFKGKRLGEIPLDDLRGYCNYILDKANMENGGRISGMALEFMKHAELLTGAPKGEEMSEVPF